MLVSNRSFARAQALASEFGGRAVRFDDCLKAMVAADIVVSSTGCSRTIFHRSDIAAMMRQRRHRSLVLIDIAVPRDVAADVQELDNVYVYNIDDLEKVVRENHRQREQQLARCHTIIAERTRALMARIAPRPDFKSINITANTIALPEMAAT